MYIKQNLSAHECERHINTFDVHHRWRHQHFGQAPVVQNRLPNNSCKLYSSEQTKYTPTILIIISHSTKSNKPKKKRKLEVVVAKKMRWKHQESTASCTTKIKAKQPNESDSGRDRTHRMYIIILGFLNYINSNSFFSHFHSSHLASAFLLLNTFTFLLLLRTLALLIHSFGANVCVCVSALRSISRASEEVVFIKLIVTNWNPFNLLWNLSISDKIEAEIQTSLYCADA